MRTSRYGRYLLGLVVSNVGTWTYNIAASVYVFRETESALLVGMVTSAQFLGTVVLAPWAGSAADRFDRRRLLLVVQTIGAVLTGALAAAVALDVAGAPLVIATSVLLGFGLAFTTPSLQALLPQLVDEADLDVAVAVNSLSFNVARAVGPVLAAGLIATVGIATSLGVNAVSFMVFVVALIGVRPVQRERHAEERIVFRSTLREAWSNREIRILLVVVAVASAAVDPVTTLAPAFTTTVFDLDDAFTGVLVASFGTGAVLTATLLLERIRRLPNALGWCLTGTAVGVGGYAAAPHIAIAVPALAVAGGGFLSSVSRSTARMHVLVDDGRLGRMMAIWSLAFLGTRPVSALVDGALADLAGPRLAAATMALPALVVGVRLLRRRGTGPRSPVDHQ